MATFGELKNKVSLRLKDPNNVEQFTTAPIVATALNDAIDYWSKRRYFFNEFEETVALVENNPVLPPLTTTSKYFLNPDGIVLDYASTRWIVKQVSPFEYDRMNVEGRGIPFAYCERNDGYELYYYPDNAYNAIVRGIKGYDDFATDGSQDATSNDFTTNAPDLIMYEALSRLYGEMKQDDKMESYYAARAQNEHNSLIRESNRKKMSGRITAEGF